MSRARLLNFAAVGFSLFVVESCTSLPAPEGTKFDRQDQAAKVLVGVQSVAPFEDYIVDLQPRFTLTPEEALADAISQSQIEELTTLRTTLANLVVNLPTVSRVVTDRQERDKNELAINTREQTTTRTSGAVPSAAQPDVLEKALEVLATPSEQIAVDASLRFRTATALLQEVNLLSHYVKDAAIRNQTIPYVVRLLITIFPSARRSAYDVELSITFQEDSTKEFLVIDSGATPRFDPSYRSQVEDWLKQSVKPASSECSKMVEVIPLFVTDNVESSLVLSSRASLGELGLGFSGGGAPVGAQVQLAKRDEKGQRTAGRDFNGLFTVGRLTDHGVGVRLGAPFIEGSNQLLSRTYNLTVLILAKLAYLSPPTERADKANYPKTLFTCQGIEFAAHSDLRSSSTGIRLDSPAIEDLVDSVKSESQMFGIVDDKIPEMMRAALRGSFEDFVLAADHHCCRSPASKEGRDLATLWPSYVSKAAAAGFSHGSFELFARDTRLPPELTINQIPDPTSPDPSKIKEVRQQLEAPLIDDGKTSSIRISGGVGLSSEGLSGLLRFNYGGEPVDLHYTSSKVQDNGTTMVLEFPSVKALFKDGAGGDPPKTVFVQIFYRSPARRWIPDDNVTLSLVIQSAVLIDTKPKEEKKAASLKAFFTIEKRIDQLRATGPGTGQVELTFKAEKGDDIPKFTHVYFVINGGHVTASNPSTEFLEDAHKAAVDTRYLLGLGGLVPGSKVSVKAWRLQEKTGDMPGEKSTEAIPAAPIEVTVVGPERIE